MFVEPSMEPVFFKFHFLLKILEMARMRCMDYGERLATNSALFQIYITLLLKDLDACNFKGWKSESSDKLFVFKESQREYRVIATSCVLLPLKSKKLNKRSLSMLLAYNCILIIRLQVICSQRAK